jgi:hypothetical protein
MKRADRKHWGGNVVPGPVHTESADDGSIGAAIAHRREPWIDPDAAPGRQLRQSPGRGAQSWLPSPSGRLFSRPPAAMLR